MFTNNNRTKTQRIILRTNQLKDIAENFILTNHSQERLMQRFGKIDREIISNRLLNPILAYRNNDGSMNIAINEFEYFVVKYSENNEPVVVTFKEASYNNYSIYDKFILCLKGYKRGQFDNQEEITVEDDLLCDLE